MIRYLLDTNVLLRWSQLSSPQRPAARNAIHTLHRRGETLCITPQNVIEFWSVSTRPATARGGFGLSPEQARHKVARLLHLFTLLSDTDDVFDEWQRIVATNRITGANVHDARLAAVMRVHAVTHILTFDTGDFARYPGVTVVDPATV